MVVLVSSQQLCTCTSCGRLFVLLLIFNCIPFPIAFGWSKLLTRFLKLIFLLEPLAYLESLNFKRYQLIFLSMGPYRTANLGMRVGNLTNCIIVWQASKHGQWHLFRHLCGHKFNFSILFRATMVNILDKYKHWVIFQEIRYLWRSLVAQMECNSEFYRQIILRGVWCAVQAITLLRCPVSHSHTWFVLNYWHSYCNINKNSGHTDL